MARSGNKDRGLFERPAGSGNWYVRCYERGKEKWIKARNKTEARITYNRIKAAEIEGRISPIQRRVSFKELAEERKRYADAHHKRKGDDNPRVQRWIDAFGNVEAATITPSAIERVMCQMKEEGYETATINRYLVTLKAIYNRAVRDERLMVNPAARVSLWKANNELVRFLTPEQEATLFEKLPNHYHPVVQVAIHTGLRQGELLRLTWGDVVFATGILTVKESKSGEAHRVPMNSVVQGVFSNLKGKERTDRIFPHDGSRLRKVFSQAVKDAELEPFRFHDLRHTFASRLAMQGANDRTIMALGGWKSPRMLNRYAHLSPTHLWQAVEGLTQMKPERKEVSDPNRSKTVAGKDLPGGDVS